MKTRIPIVFLAPVLAVALFACSPQPQAQPASFQVISLGVTPEQVLAGQDALVTAQVINTGGMAGNFIAELTMNGEQVASRTITIQPDKIAKLTFNVTRDSPGTYKIELGSAGTNLIVKAVEEREVELKYDNGVSQDALWAGYNNGFLISFIPPAKPFILKKIRICGGIYGVAWEGKTFELSVLDQFYTPLYSEVWSIAKFPVRSAFPYREPSWVDFDIPPLNIENPFFVYLYTNMSKHKGIHVGVDDSVPNEHSDLASGTPPNLSIVSIDDYYTAGIWYSDRTKVNWMIRAVGNALMPASP